MKCLALPLIFLTSAAFAGSFTPPKGCTAHLTVQSRGCIVSHFYTCDGDHTGDQWRADYDAGGAFFLSKIDRDAQWLESYQFNPTTKEVMDPAPNDPASFSDLLATGLDTFDFALSRDDGEHSTIKGYDKLTGATAVIDGVTLQQTEYEYTQTDAKGKVMRHSKGHEYISAKWRTFFSGHSEWEDTDGNWTGSDNAPVKFIDPGKPGFGATVPLFECSDQMSELALPQSHGKPAGGS